MTGLLDVVASKLAERALAERWVTGLVPAAGFWAAVWVASRLGQVHAWDIQMLIAVAGQTALTVASWSVGAKVFALAVLAAVAAGSNLLVQGIAAAATTRLWLGQTEAVPGLRRLTARRTARLHRRWKKAVDERDASLPGAAAAAGTGGAVGDGASPDHARRAHLAVLRISLAEPARATWMGNRIHALQTTFAKLYDLDLAWAWPSLWTVLPEPVRADLATAYASFTRAATRATWALPWVALAVWWWPGLLVAAALAVTGWRAARSAIDTFAQLAEAAVDVHAPILAVQLGLTPTPEPLTTKTGAKITEVAGKNRQYPG